MTLEELFSMDEGFPVEAGALLAEGALPVDEEAQILARIREKAGAALPKKEEKEPVRKTRFGLMLLAAVLILGTVASAAAYFQPDGLIARTLGVASEGWQEFFKGNGSTINAGQDCKGWNLTVSQAVGDRSYAYIMVDLTAPEGVVLDADGYSLDHEIKFFGSYAGMVTSRMVEDTDKTDNHISFMIETTIGGFPWVRSGHLEVTGLKEAIKTGKPEPEDVEIRDYPEQLSWDIKFPLKFKNRPIVYRFREPIEMNGGTVKINKVEISQLSGRVILSSEDGGLGLWEVGNDTWEAPDIELLDEDGNPFPTSGSNTRSHGAAGIMNRVDHTATFRPIIDPERVAAFSIDGVVIPLK